MKKLVFILSCLFLIGCASQKLIQTVYLHDVDTCYINKVHQDSIYLKDSIYIKDKGDTVTIDRWHTKYIEKLRLDTIYKAHNDTIISYQEKITEVKYTPAIYKWSLGIMIVLIVGILIYTGIKLYLKFK